MIRVLLALALWCVAASGWSAPTSDYFIHFMHRQQAGMIVWQDTRQWTSLWITHLNGDVQWRDPNTSDPGSFEQMFQRDGYWILGGFEHKWSADCTRAEIEDINTGAIAQLDCSKGHPYAPFLLPRDPWRMRVWGLIAGSRRFYWESDFYPSQQVFNGCWYQGGQTREAIVQDDSWWTKEDGWTRATGTEPYDFAGNPVRPTVNKTYRVTVAKGAGVWTIHENGARSDRCAYSVWDWN